MALSSYGIEVHVDRKSRLAIERVADALEHFVQHPGRSWRMLVLLRVIATLMIALLQASWRNGRGRRAHAQLSRRCAGGDEQARHEVRL